MIDFSTDVSVIVPLDLSVIEFSTVPIELSCEGGWKFEGGKINAVPVDHVAEAFAQKVELLAEADRKIEVLQDAVTLGMATEEETDRLTAWRIYRVLLDRVDISAPNVKWPANSGGIS